MGKINFYTQGTSFLPKGRMRIREWILSSAKAEGFKVGEISYIFCSGEEHLGINRQYLGHDYRTDVITFDYSEPEEGYISGDVFIDPETVCDNSREWNTSEREEMLRVIVHGMLHLCGYKDKEPEAQKVMRSKENHYLGLFDEAGL